MFVPPKWLSITNHNTRNSSGWPLPEKTTQVLKWENQGVDGTVVVVPTIHHRQQELLWNDDMAEHSNGNRTSWVMFTRSASTARYKHHINVFFWWCRHLTQMHLNNLIPCHAFIVANDWRLCKPLTVLPKKRVEILWKSLLPLVAEVLFSRVS